MSRQYRIRNWSEYNAALKQRGSLTFWLSDEVIEQCHKLHMESTSHKIWRGGYHTEASCYRF